MHALDLVNECLDHPNETFNYEGLEVSFTNNELCKLRLIVPPDHADNGELRTLAYDTITTLLSETTNNDACDVIVRERSAHFNTHGDLPDHVRDSTFGHYVVIDAEVLDELS